MDTERVNSLVERIAKIIYENEWAHSWEKLNSQQLATQLYTEIIEPAMKDAREEGFINCLKPENHIQPTTKPELLLSDEEIKKLLDFTGLPIDDARYAYIQYVKSVAEFQLAKDQSYYEGIIAKLEKERGAAIKEIGVQARQVGKLEVELASKDAEIKELKEHYMNGEQLAYFQHQIEQDERGKTLKEVYKWLDNKPSFAVEGLENEPKNGYRTYPIHDKEIAQLKQGKMP
jgi:hypothetical protein